LSALQLAINELKHPEVKLKSLSQKHSSYFVFLMSYRGDEVRKYSVSFYAFNFA
jgi:hypothetical protein